MKQLRIMLVMLFVLSLLSSFTEVTAFAVDTKCNRRTTQQRQTSTRRVAHRNKYMKRSTFSTTLFLNEDDSDNDYHRSRRSVLMKSLPRSLLAVAGVIGSLSGTMFIPESVHAQVLLSSEGLSTIVYGDGDDIMKPKEHGTSKQPVQSNLLYNVNNQLADKICNYNRHFAEPAGYFTKTALLDTVLSPPTSPTQPITFYDSVTGVPLFRTPGNGRTIEDFVVESEYHGWPSFRDNEVVWDNVRVLRGSGEVVSKSGTHLGHNIADKKGNRYCINLVSIAGQPIGST
jgi:hypothetical protein